MSLKVTYGSYFFILRAVQSLAVRILKFVQILAVQSLAVRILKFIQILAVHILKFSAGGHHGVARFINTETS